MPAQILHTLFGEDATGELTADYPRAREFEGAFSLGCQGPDLFYHSRRRRPVAVEYGSLLHRRGFGSFAAALLRRSLAAEPTELAWYALGFASHAALDRALHPYIVYKAAWAVPSRPETARYARNHAFFERIIDVLLLRMLRGTSPRFWDQRRLLAEPCSHPPAGLAAVLKESFLEAYPERAGKDEKLAERIANALQDGAVFYEMTDPRTAARAAGGAVARAAAAPLDERRGRAYLALIHPERLPLDIDYLNLARREWRHPCEEAAASDGAAANRRSLVELYGEALTGARSFFARLIGDFRRTGTIPSDTAERLGNGTLSVGDREGKPCAPVHAEALPLDEVLEGLYRRISSGREREAQARAR